jgi:sialic acid synthase SpsE
MRAHISNAKAAGADAVKFQWTSAAKAICERRRAPEYLDAYKLIEFPRTWLYDLADEANDVKLDFMCTVYLPEDIVEIVPLVNTFKIASFEATDDAFIQAHDEWPQTPVFISTGMLDLRQTAEQIGKVCNLGGVFHCVSAYPTPPDQVHLDAISQLRGMVSPVPVGFSDHTRLRPTGGLAVAAGAQLIEVHARLEDTPTTNADYVVSHGPQSLVEYIAFVRQAEVMVGHGIKRPQPCEEEMAKFQVHGG